MAEATCDCPAIDALRWPCNLHHPPMPRLHLHGATSHTTQFVSASPACCSRTLSLRRSTCLPGSVTTWPLTCTCSQGSTEETDAVFSRLYASQQARAEPPTMPALSHAHLVGSKRSSPTCKYPHPLLLARSPCPQRRAHQQRAATPHQPMQWPAAAARTGAGIDVRERIGHRRRQRRPHCNGVQARMRWRCSKRRPTTREQHALC